MKAKDLIHELQKFDPENDVAIYNEAMGNALIIPDYEPSITIARDSDFAEEWEFDLDTVFITGK